MASCRGFKRWAVEERAKGAVHSVGYFASRHCDFNDGEVVWDYVHW